MFTIPSRSGCRPHLTRALAVWAALVAMAAPIGSAAMTVQPVILDLKTYGRDASSVVTVQNSFSEPLPVELKVEDGEFTEDSLHSTGKETSDLLVFPPQAVIPPGETQSFRVQYVGDPELTTSRHYFTSIVQLPVSASARASTIQLLYDFQVVVSVAPKGVAPHIVVTDAAVAEDKEHHPQPLLTVGNDSAAYGYLSNGRLRIVQADASGREIFRRVLSGPEIQQMIGFGMVAANQHRRILIPVTLPSPSGAVRAEFVAAKSR